jgi:nucleotide-binding universal stress UspA family protein
LRLISWQELQMKVLLAVDGSDCSAAAVEEVVTRPWPADTEVRVISAFQVPLTPTPEAWAIPDDYYEEMERTARCHAQSVIEAARNRLVKEPRNHLLITSDVFPGSPRTAILAEADRWKPDLIVVGSHGYGAWQRFLLGSVSQAVVSHAKCSVEVVRCCSAMATTETRAA